MTIFPIMELDQKKQQLWVGYFDLFSSTMLCPNDQWRPLDSLPSNSHYDDLDLKTLPVLFCLEKSFHVNCFITYIRVCIKSKMKDKEIIISTLLSLRVSPSHGTNSNSMAKTDTHIPAIVIQGLRLIQILPQ